jgi:hypothetical protein
MKNKVDKKEVIQKCIVFGNTPEEFAFANERGEALQAAIKKAREYIDSLSPEELKKNRLQAERWGMRMSV